MENKRKKQENAIFIITVIAMSVYLLWRLFFTLPIHGGWFPLLMGVLLLWAEIEAALGTFELFWRRGRVVHMELPDIPDSWYPHVDVFVATHNEPVDLLYKTVNACTFMDYPDKDKVHIYLCDDGNRPEMEALAGELGVTWLGLAENKHAKSGNFNNALAKTASPLVVTFDSDMIPRRDFLRKSIPYFFLPQLKKDESGRWVPRAPEEVDEGYKIGFIQTPQNFYNPDLFQHNLFSERSIPNEQDFFTKEINVMRNSSNAAAYTGSNTVLARAALMEIGGFPTDTITEDFETGILIQAKGYTTYATGEVLASGLTPTSIKSMFSQRVRWARGVIQSIKNTRLPFNRALSPSARISYMVSFSYWWSFARRFIFTMAPILFALFGLQIAVVGFWPLLAFWVPSHFFYSVSMRILSSDTRSQRWAQIIDTIMMPYMILPVLLETLGFRQKKFKVTKKTGAEKPKERSFHYAIPHLILLGMSVAALVRFAGGKYGMALLYSSVIIFWLVYNLINLLYAVFFMMGRPIYRQCERFLAEEPLRLEFDGHTLETTTTDLSEGGLSFTLERPDYIPDDEPIRFTVQTPYYRASFTGQLVYVKQVGSQWRYSAKITDLPAAEKRQYMQIVYDRLHSLPTKLDSWVTAPDDLLMNAVRRTEKQTADMRALPRIKLDAALAGCTLVDFNYRYALLAGLKPAPSGEEQVLPLAGGLAMVLAAPKEIKRPDSPSLYLYRVENWRQLAYSPAFAALLDGWMASRPHSQPQHKWAYRAGDAANDVEADGEPPVPLAAREPF